MSAAGPDLPIEGKTVRTLVALSAKRSYEAFAQGSTIDDDLCEKSQLAHIACKYADEYAHLQDAAPPASETAANGAPSEAADKHKSRSSTAIIVSQVSGKAAQRTSEGEAAKRAREELSKPRAVVTTVEGTKEYLPSVAIAKRLASRWPRPRWHAPWRCYRTIAGHLGWVRSIAFDVSNDWFVTGSADRTIKLWDTATGQQKLTLTGHIEQVTGLAVSSRHPYMFSCGLDKKVMCWDLEYNKVIRHYHGHLSGVYALTLHPELDLLMTGGRDSACRVWDMRTKLQVHCLSGHQSTVSSILSQSADPQVITGSHDNSIRLWDIRTGKTTNTLTHHKHSVRAMAMSPHEWAFIGASADNIKKYKLPEGDFLHNMIQNQKAIINSACVNDDGVVATGADNGSLWFWDWTSGNCFQQGKTLPQPGSLESEAGIFAMAFDQSGSRLVTCEADKSIKMWKEDETATPETHPVQFRPPKDVVRRY